MTIAPFVLAWRHPPPGRAFTGFFTYQEDYYQYLSFVEQARSGHFLFVNKYDLRPLPAFLVNLEWWSAGVLARVLGGNPILGFHALGVLASFAFVLAVARILGLAGLSGSRLGWGLALVLAAGGLGWARLLAHAPFWSTLDLVTAIYPWAQRLGGGAHAIGGTALLLWSLLLHTEWRAGRRAAWPWVACAWVLGLTRPFDLGVFGVVAVALEVPGLLRGGDVRGVLARLLSLAWLAPVLFYDALAFGLHPSFAPYSGQNAVGRPPLLDLAWACGPAALLALASLRQVAPATAGAEVVPMLRTAAVVVPVLLLLPVGWSFQFANSLGVFLLLLAALGVPGRLAAPAFALLVPSSLVLLATFFQPPAQWFSPQDYFVAARALRPSCGAADVAVAPVNMSLMLAGLTPCRVAIGHRILTPDMEDRARESVLFYDAATSPAWRRAFLDRIGATLVFLPAGRAGWLGSDPPFARRLALPLFEVWGRAEGPP